VAQTTLDGQPQFVCLRQQPFTAEEVAVFAARSIAPSATVVTDGLWCFGEVQIVGAEHNRTVTGGGKASTELPQFKAINTFLGNLKRSLGGTYHAFDFAKYAHRYLAEAQYRFNRRFDSRAPSCPGCFVPPAFQFQPRLASSAWLRLIANQDSFYGQNLTEEQLLKAMDKGDGMASFADMARALSQFGFRAQGFAASWEQLTQLRMPVVVYVKHRRTDHFSVLRGIGHDSVWLADPSLGNRTYSRAQFLAMWQTRTKAEDGLAGKFLAVLPVDAGLQAQTDFFTRSPVRQSAPAVGNLASQAWRP